ncbi:MAG: hypothetical protein J5795_02165 [Lachnospiraceae bacterium]|nr:hypothetical protein [Lachnospiraceae bacterium]
MSVNSVVNHCVMPKDMFNAKMWKAENVFAGNSTFDIVVSPASKKNGAIQFHIAALKDDSVVTFDDLNKTLYDVTVGKYFDELNDRLASAMESHVKWIHTGNHDIYVSYGGTEQWEENTSLKKQAIRLILMVKNVEKMNDQEELTLRKILKGELLEWMDSVILDRPAIEKTKQDYENDLVHLMDPSMLPHSKELFNPVPIITLVGIIFAILGVFYSKLLLFQVGALVLGAYAAYRSYQKGMREYTIINAIVCVISLYFIYYGYVNA